MTRFFGRDGWSMTAARKMVGAQRALGGSTTKLVQSVWAWISSLPQLLLGFAESVASARRELCPQASL